MRNKEQCKTVLDDAVLRYVSNQQEGEKGTEGKKVLGEILFCVKGIKLGK